MLELRNVTKEFGGLRAVDSLTMTVEAGKITGIIGPNGAGKTTVFNLITSVFRVTSGEIWFEGRDITRLNSYEVIRLGIVRTFQNIRLFRTMRAEENLLVAQNVRANAPLFGALPIMGERERRLRERRRELLSLSQLTESARRWAGTLPFVDQRRLEISRALATEPKLLLLDEPAAGMNATEAQALVEELRGLQARGITILLIEHDMSVVMGLCDYVYVLNFGKKIAEGTPDEVRTNPAVLEAYLGTDE